MAGWAGPDAGVVDQHVDPAECLHRGIHQGLALLGHRHVGRDCQRLAAGGLDERGSLGQPVDAACTEHDVGAGLGERLGERHTQPRRGAGDHHYFVVQSE